MNQQPKKKTKKQRENSRMSKEGTPLHFVVRAHLHPETFEPLLRFKIEGKVDVSVPVSMMRHLAAMLTDGAIMAELMAGHAALLRADPDITMEQFGEQAGEQPTEAELNKAIHEASLAFQNMLIEAWELGAVRGGPAVEGQLPAGLQGLQDQINIQLQRMRERLNQPFTQAEQPAEDPPAATG